MRYKIEYISPIKDFIFQPVAYWLYSSAKEDFDLAKVYMVHLKEIRLLKWSLSKDEYQLLEVYKFDAQNNLAYKKNP